MSVIETSKSVSEIVSALRSKGYQLDMIPSDISGGVRSSFSAVLHGSGGGMLGGRNEPGVKVVIYDSGDSRRVELEALSTSPMGQKFNLKKGEQLCDQLYSELNEGSAVSEPQPVETESEPISSPSPAPAITEENAANETPNEPKKKDDFATKFMKGFKEINPTAPSAPAVTEPTPESVATAAPAFAEMPKPDYIKPSISTDEYSAPSVGDSTWRCEKCGKINIGDSRYCGNCGSQKPEKNRATEPPAPGPVPKPINKKVIIIAAVIVFALIVAIPVLSKLSSTPSYDDEYYDDPYNDSYDDSGMEDSYEYGEPISADASSQHDAMGDNYYYPENAIDNDLATAWVEGADGDGVGEWISVTFSNVDSMNGLWIRNGYQKSEEAYETNNRVKEAYVEFEDGSVDKFVLEDKNNEAQPIFFSEEKPGNSIKLIIKSVYHSEDELDTCITEIELLTAYGSNKPVIQAEKVK